MDLNPCLLDPWIIAERWELSNDVAGATLMAAGGSAPELATSFVGTFKV
jgi:Ca2+/Na+ antiporter